MVTKDALIRALAHALCLVAGFLGWSTASAEQREPSGNHSPAASIEILQEEARAIQRGIREREADLDQVMRRESDVLSALERVDLTIQRHRRLAAVLKARTSELDRQISSTAEALEDVNGRIRANKAHLGARLVALYKTSRLGASHLVAPAASISELLSRQTALERILSYDERLRLTFQNYCAELRNLQAQLKAQQAEQGLRTAEYEQAALAAGSEWAQREKLLLHLRSEKEVQLAAIDSLRGAARALDQKLQSLVRQTGPQDVPEGIPSKPFAAMKGLLIFPVSGKMTNLFGAYRDPRLNVQGFRNGVDFAAERGDPVRTVHDGIVLFAGWFRGYGNLVIIDHGDHYYSVYAHLEDIFKSVDNRVAAGDVIATVGDLGTMDEAGLYFELRHGDRSLNPMEWLARR